MNLLWNEPRRWGQRGLITGSVSHSCGAYMTGYLIEYVPSTTTTFEDGTVATPSSVTRSFNVTSAPMTTSLGTLVPDTLPNLLPYINYKIRIAAINVVAIGPFCEYVINATLPAGISYVLV
jgi:hypothetical protein